MEMLMVRSLLFLAAFQPRGLSAMVAKKIAAGGRVWFAKAAQLTLTNSRSLDMISRLIKAVMTVLKRLRRQIKPHALKPYWIAKRSKKSPPLSEAHMVACVPSPLRVTIRGKLDSSVLSGLPIAPIRLAWDGAAFKGGWCVWG